MNTKENIKRIEYIDFARGFAMLLCIIGHAGVTGLVRGYIYSYHMPLFFIISGMVYKNKDSIGNFIQKKSKELFIPYIFWSIVWLVFWWGVYFAASRLGFENDKNFSLKDSVIGLLLDTRGEKYGGYLWFFYALFVTIVFFDTLQKIKSKWIKISILIFLMIIELIYLYTGAPDVPFCLDVLPLTLVFMYAGYLFRGGTTQKLLNRINRRRSIVIAICIIVHILTFVINYLMYGPNDMYTRSYGNIILYFAESILGSFACVLLCESLCKNKDEISMLLKRFFVWLGNNTIIYYALHTMVYVVLRNISRIILVKLHYQWLADMLINPAVDIVIAITIIFLINHFFIKYMPIVVGKKRSTK